MKGKGGGTEEGGEEGDRGMVDRRMKREVCGEVKGKKKGVQVWKGGRMGVVKTVEVADDHKQKGREKKA